MKKEEHFTVETYLSVAQMEEQEVNPSPRRRRPKDSFQKELQAKLRQRKFQGLAVDFSDSGDDDDNDDVLGSNGLGKYYV